MEVDHFALRPQKRGGLLGTGTCRGGGGGGGGAPGRKSEGHWKGTLYLRAAVQRRGQRPPKSLGTDKTVEAA